MKRWIMLAALLVLVAVPGVVLAQADITALTVAARQGDPAAQKQLGVLYASGEGVVQDYAAARRWWR
jgi:TPR repeat protein